MFTRWTLERLLGRLGYRVVRSSAGRQPLNGYMDHQVAMPQIERLDDDELQLLNGLLPWAAFLADRRGRRFGAAFSADKRAEPQRVPDPRIVELDRRIGLAGRAVLEVGCFEGIHTSALCMLGANVIAVDGRIENVVKTIVRCAMLDHHPYVTRVDLDRPTPPGVDVSCDVLHHVGVLYHIVDPVAHLDRLLATTRQAVMLDTHVAPDTPDLPSYESGGRTWPYQPFQEAGRAAPFAGLQSHAKWLREADIVSILRTRGFGAVDITRREAERNGLRILLYATR